jgi:AraC family transcriptional regulator
MIEGRMDCRIETIAIKKLVGIKVIMSISSDRTRELWHSFMSGRKEIKNTSGQTEIK